MAADDAGLLAEFAEFMRARQEAAAADNDPDNERDITIQGKDGSLITLPWRKAKEYDLDSFLEGVGIKRKAAAAQGGDGDGSTGDGKGKKAGTGGTPPATGGAATVANLFRTKPQAGKSA